MTNGYVLMVANEPTIVIFPWEQREQSSISVSTSCPRAKTVARYLSQRTLSFRRVFLGVLVGFSRKLSFAMSPGIAGAIYYNDGTIFTAACRCIAQEAPAATTALIVKSPLFACSGVRESRVCRVISGSKYS